jgi:hypothetical protein
MHVFLRSKQTQVYYAGPGRWSPRRGQALDMESFENANRACQQEGLANMEALLRYEVIAAEVAVPICRPELCLRQS